MYRVTIRATQEEVPQALARQMELKLAQGMRADEAFD
jgi:AP-2 complex subunit alpha